jgi:hypothetical protein
MQGLIDTGAIALGFLLRFIIPLLLLLLYGSRVEQSHAAG